MDFSELTRALQTSISPIAMISGIGLLLSAVAFVIWPHVIAFPVALLAWWLLGEDVTNTAPRLALALDVIDQLGPTGSYLEHEHTIRHYREPFYSKLADKSPFAVWQKKGATTMEARAAKQVASRLDRTFRHERPGVPPTGLPSGRTACSLRPISSVASGRASRSCGWPMRTPT